MLVRFVQHPRSSLRPEPLRHVGCEATRAVPARPVLASSDRRTSLPWMRRSLRVRGHDRHGRRLVRAQPHVVGRARRHPRRLRLLRRRPLFGRWHATSCLRDRGGRRRHRARPRPPPVPLRHGHPRLGAPRRARGRRRPAASRRSSRPASSPRARASTPSSWWPTCTTRRHSPWPRRSTASTRASARSAGSPTSTRGRASSHELLRPGGRLHLVEFHPVTHWCLSETDLTVKYSYFHEGPWVWDDDPDEPVRYADPDATFEHNDTVEWNHGIGAIVTALAGRGCASSRWSSGPRASCSAGRSRWSAATRTGASRRTCPRSRSASASSP